MYEKILVAVDHSEASGRALTAARELAALSHGEVWVVHLREREAMGKTDLDFFTADTLDEDLLLSSLQGIEGLAVRSKGPETLHLHVGLTKVSFLGYHYPMLFPFKTYAGIAIADPREQQGIKRREEPVTVRHIKHLSEKSPGYSRLASLTHLREMLGRFL